MADLHTHENGYITYNGDLFTGKATERASDGSRRKEYFYVEGTIVSAREWHSNGGIKFERVYENGIPEGPALEWDEKGAIEQVLFRNGNIVERMPGGSLNQAQN